jgi:hypothetical protein
MPSNQNLVPIKLEKKKENRYKRECSAEIEA